MPKISKDTSIDYSTTQYEAENIIKEKETKVVAALWIIGVLITLAATHFFKIIQDPSLVNIMFIRIGFFMLGCCLALFLYLSIYLPYFKKVYDDWNEYCPNVIYGITILSSIAFLSFNIGLWPQWGLLTPILLVFFFTGIMMISHFIPSF
ncbi:hypothetical protein WA158_000205 [Blastocystis sp. Blastoise]